MPDSRHFTILTHYLPVPDDTRFSQSLPQSDSHVNTPVVSLLLAVAGFGEVVLAALLGITAAIILVGFLYWCFQGYIRPFLTRHKAARSIVAAVLALTSIVGSGLIVEAANLSELFEANEVEVTKVWMIFAALFTATTCIIVQTILTLIDEDVNDSLYRTKGELKQAKTDLQKAKQVCAEAEADRDFYENVTEVFLDVITQKQRTVSQLMQTKENGQVTLPELHKAMSPEERRAALLQKTFHIFYEWIKQKSKKPELRLAYFRIEENTLVIAHCWDQLGNYNCVQIPNASMHHFDAMSGDAMVANSARSGKIVVSEDSDKDHTDTSHPFVHFEKSGEILSRGTIRSAISLPIGSVENGCCGHVLWLDCNIRKFFRETYLDRYKFVMNNLQRRFLYEIEFEKIFENWA